MARYDDLNTNMIAYATVLSIVVLVLVLQGTQALTNSMVNYEDAKKIQLSSDAPAKLKESQIASLDGYKRVHVPDLASGQEGVTKEVLMIPITEAKQVVLKEFATQP